MSAQKIRRLIVKTLRRHPEGLTIVSIAKLTGLHRHTCTKYIHEFMGAGAVYQRKVGAAKLCYLRENIDEKRLLKKLKRRRIGGGSQIKLIAIVVVLTFLLSETAIFAYQNSSLFNSTNVSQISNINTSPMTSSSSNMSDFDEILNTSQETNKTSKITRNITSNVSTEKNLTNSNETVDNFNGTNISVPESNETALKSNETNQTSLEDNKTNQTVPKINKTLPNKTPEKPSKTGLELDISLEYPEKMTRGEVVDVKITVMNIDSLIGKNVVISWRIPDGFETVSETGRKFCGTLEPNSSCVSEIKLKTDTSTVLGISEIRVVVSYET